MIADNLDTDRLQQIFQIIQTQVSTHFLFTKTCGNFLVVHIPMLLCLHFKGSIYNHATGVTYQGEKAVVAICFDNILSLSVSSTEVQKVIKKLKIGMTNLAKDFVPTNSIN